MKYLISISAFAITIGASAQPTVGLIQYTTPPSGYMLFAPIANTRTYLLDPCGREVHQWNSSYQPGLGAQLQPDGTLYRTGNVNNTIYQGGGRGGVIERWSWDGDLLWSYALSNDSLCQHHDFTVLPNGNLLVIAWDRKTGAEAIARGKNPALTQDWLLSERIMELQPTGTNDAVVVWQWKLWDHLVQAFDAGLPNYAVVSEHPERMNINFVQGLPTNTDWIHLNGIDYNEELDQILVSSHAMDEIWVIDHSTSTQEAAGSTGGNSGKGGDLLYRWGNPRAYGRGVMADQRLFGQHHATWLPEGHTHAGKILVFNNGLGRPAGQYSSLDIIAPPVDENGAYEVPATTAYLPANVFWSWTEPVPTDFFAQNISGVFPVEDGFLATDGPEGRFLFIDGSNDIGWEYINPVNNGGPVAQGSTIASNSTFRCEHYAADFPGFAGHDLAPGDEIELDPIVPSLCVTTSIGHIYEEGHPELVEGYPNPANDHFTITGTSIAAVELFEVDGRSTSLPISVQGDRCTVDVSKMATGIYNVRVQSTDGTRTITRLLLAR